MGAGEDLRLIEAGFPCHQVGAETKREQSVGLPPPVNRLHVGWARRPLTPSRAAIVPSLGPAGADPDTFVRQLGIERLHDGLKDLDRVELIAYRVAQFTREEAVYWLSRTTSFGPSANRWALSGLRIMLGGHPKDPDIGNMLERFRAA